MRVIGRFQDGKVAFNSQNLRGLIDYGRKHGATVALGDCISGNGLYRVTFSNGVVCEGEFADPGVMLGFFLGRGFVDAIECDRVVFNKGTALGRINVPSLAPIGRDGTLRFGPWLATAHRDENQTPLVKFVRD